jgi:hypothetical protein
MKSVTVEEAVVGANTNNIVHKEVFHKSPKTRLIKVVQWKGTEHRTYHSVVWASFPKWKKAAHNCAVHDVESNTSASVRLGDRPGEGKRARV